MQFTKRVAMLSLVVVMTMGLGITVTNDWGDRSIQVTYNEAIAKFKSGGFSSSRTKVSSFRSSKPKAYKTPTPTYKPKPVVPKAKPKPAAFAKAGQRATAKQAATKQAASFKKPVTATAQKSTLAKASPATMTRVRNVDRSSYYSNRNTTMNRYASNSRVPNTVVVMGSPSYGVYDSWFMWHVVMSDPYWGYHNYNNPAYMSWKREARELSRENAELQKQLDEHEASMAGATGDRNADYLPPGIDNADVIFAPAYVEATKPVVRFCTGRNDGKYAQAGIKYKTVVSEADIQIVFTEGSVQNLSMIADGKCDAAFTQRDAYIAYNGDNPLNVTRVGALYNEAVHMFCAKDSDVTHLADLNDRTDIRMWVGEKGSGSAVTWDNFKSLNDKLVAATYKKSATSGSFGKGKLDCGIYVGYLNSPFMQTVSKSKTIRMIDIESVPVNEIMDPENQAVYGTYTIDADTYNIQTGWNDMGIYAETPTVTVPVDIIVSDAWKAATATSTGILEELQSTRSDVVSAL